MGVNRASSNGVDMALKAWPKVVEEARASAIAGFGKGA
jgi:hypothetical protein